MVKNDAGGNKGKGWVAKTPDSGTHYFYYDLTWEEQA